MIKISSSIWTLLVVSLSTLACYSILLLRNNKKLLKRLTSTTSAKELMVAGYLVIGFAMVTASVHFVPYVPDPSVFSSPFHNAEDAFLFGLSWAILIFLATISYGIFKNSRYPEIYLLGILIFMGLISIVLYPFIHTDFGSQFSQGLIGVGILAILSVNRLSIGPYLYRFLWSLSHIVLVGFAIWFIITGIAMYFRFEPKPGKSLIYTGYLMLGAVWLYFEGIITSSRYIQADSNNPVGSTAIEPQNPDDTDDKTGEESTDMDLPETGNGTESIPIRDTSRSPSLPSPATEPVCITPVSEYIPLLRIYCLGPFRIVHGEETMDTRVLNAYQKPLEILKIIAISPNREVSRENILDYLWDGSEGDKAVTAFQKALSRLRNLLDGTELKKNKDSYVVAQGGRYTLHPHYTLIDIVEFLKQVNIGKRYLEDRLYDNALLAFLKAEELWQGTLLEGQTKPWLIHERLRMEKIYINLHIETARLLLKKKEYPMAETCIQKSLAIDMDCEEGIRLMALAQYVQGNKREALKNINDFTGRMEKAFKTDISIKTQKLKTFIQLDKKVNPQEWV